MGAVNTALLVALAAPGTLPARWAADLADGLAAEATRAGAGIAGGDTARADSVTLAVTALGDLAGRPPVLRSGARPGDVVAVAGLLGHSAAGLALLQSGAVTPPSASPAAPTARAVPAARAASAAPGAPAAPGALEVPASSASPGADEALSGLVAAHLRPAPHYEAGPEAALLGATAMIDVSDGLISDLGHIATSSGVQINITAASLPVAPALRKAAKTILSAPSAPGAATDIVASAASAGAASAAAPAVPAAATVPAAAVPAATVPATVPAAAAAAAAGTAASTALEWVLTGGEDHALVATFPPSATLPPRWHLIGEVREGSGVTVDNTPHAGPGGWQHFR